MKLKTGKIITERLIIKFIKSIFDKAEIPIPDSFIREMVGELSPKFFSDYFLVTEIRGRYKPEYNIVSAVLYNSDWSRCVKIVISTKLRLATIGLGTIRKVFGVSKIVSYNNIITINKTNEWVN